jgi:hypothetical protein
MPAVNCGSKTQNKKNPITCVQIVCFEEAFVFTPCVNKITSCRKLNFFIGTHSMHTTSYNKVPIHAAIQAGHP